MKADGSDTSLKNDGPFSPKSDQCQISPCNNEFVVIRIQSMITQEEFPLYFILFAPTSSVGN